MSAVKLDHRWGFGASLPQEVRVTLELGLEEVTVPFGSCHQDLGGKTALGHLQSLASDREWKGAAGSHGNRGGRGSQVVPGSCRLAGRQERS